MYLRCHGARYLESDADMRYRESCPPKTVPFGEAETLGLPAGGFAVYSAINVCLDAIQ